MMQRRNHIIKVSVAVVDTNICCKYYFYTMSCSLLTTFSVYWSFYSFFSTKSLTPSLSIPFDNLHNNNKQTITHIGHDIKSLALNMATTFLFFLPIALYLVSTHEQRLYCCGGVVAMLLLAIVVPPMGWMRPHPYTDLPGNTPFLLRKQQ